MWNASHLAVRLCALRHWKRVSMPPTTQSLRHPEKTYENRFTNTNNSLQFIQKISKLSFFEQSSQHCGPQPCELKKHRIIKYLQRKKKA